MMLAFALSLFAAQPAPQATLIQCAFQKVDPASKRAVAGETRPFAVLMAANSSNGLRVFDSTNLLRGMTLSEGRFIEVDKFFAAQTDPARSEFYRFIVIRQKTGNWSGGLGLNGKGSAAEHLAGSFLGECSVSQEADSTARFEALRS